MYPLMKKVELLHFFRKMNSKNFQMAIDLEETPSHIINLINVNILNIFDCIVTYMSRKEKD